MGTARIVFDRWHDRYAERLGGVRSSAVRDLFAAASRADVISLSGGMPEVSRVPHDEVAKAAREAVHHEGAAALQYGSSNGRLQIRSLIRDLMAEIGVRLSADDVVVTAGAQQALDLFAKTMLDPGDVVITEGPTYLGALQAFSAYQPDIHCIPMDGDGMRMDLLEAELERDRAQLAQRLGQLVLRPLELLERRTRWPASASSWSRTTPMGVCASREAT